MNDTTERQIIKLRETLLDLIANTAPPAGIPTGVSSTTVRILNEITGKVETAKEKSGLMALNQLDGIVAKAKEDASGRVIKALYGVRQHLRWSQNENYKKHKHMNGYLNNSAFCEFVGPRGIYKTNEVAIGFFLMGPHIHYPNHNHPAAEVYFVLSGNAQWACGTEDWKLQPPGSSIYHSPNLNHAMRTTDDPLLALFCWHGDLQTYPNPTLN
ncbi:MAG: cupin domain-containing protein [Alphaproteobacteria bacterium]|jgi:mannose-6-phosphate isomerase-like protein (cupin superfamily)|nr:cupin domain-containing protein [Alphaproteobacteria bacterium]MBT4084601.1 cupin domain-containing protein [Alphaproteobacteria bacterium]MBT4546041.1 cupin domain-containing protein [Alphaproteobacteria bacterium]MBT7746290.1 cupin domain-containing protein [Alphaproteobacteria bacterium]